MMKAFILSLLVSVSALAHTSFIAKYQFEPGFVRPAWTQTIYLQRDHRVFLEVRDINTNHLVRAYTLATLNRRAFSMASQHVASVNSSSPLLDQNVNDPICTDRPRITVTVVQGDHEVLTYKNQNCHIWNLEDHSADPINQLMLGLGELREQPSNTLQPDQTDEAEY